MLEHFIHGTVAGTVLYLPAKFKELSFGINKAKIARSLRRDTSLSRWEDGGRKNTCLFHPPSLSRRQLLRIGSSRDYKIRRNKRKEWERKGASFKFKIFNLKRNLLLLDFTIQLYKFYKFMSSRKLDKISKNLIHNFPKVWETLIPDRWKDIFPYQTRFPHVNFI